MLLDNNRDEIQKLLETQTPLLDPKTLQAFVKRFIDARETFLNAFANQNAVMFVVDAKAIERNGLKFKKEFSTHIERARFYYAMKSNNHPYLLSALVKMGYGLDVSSGKELTEALAQNPQSLIFSGPGKTEAELASACDHADRVTVLCDSFGELKRLEAVASSKNVEIRAGVRLMIEENGLWRKFGIPLSELANFFKEAGLCKHVNVCGLQFHSSWNLDASRHTAFIQRLGEHLAALDEAFVKQITFIDIGGGYWPTDGEWMQPSATPEGKLKACLNPSITEGMDHRCYTALGIEKYAAQIAKALDEHIYPHTACDILLEPGRWISHESMHVLLKVIDKKAEDVVIVDGGTNMIGWDRFETDYFPIINLTQPGLTEHPCMVFGSLCTPHDVWGYNYFGQAIAPGDILLVPNQGAYTYSLRQEFIKGLPVCEVL